jgi:hypothetical protein
MNEYQVYESLLEVAGSLMVVMGEWFSYYC